MKTPVASALLSISLHRHGEAAAELSARQKSLAFFTLLAALALEIVDLTIVNTVLPAIEHDLRAGSAQSQWVIAAYSLSFAVLLILGGRLGDLFGGRRMFLLGVGGFTASSLLCGLAATPDHLIAARALQGVTGAMMAPQVMTMIQLLYDPVERIGRIAWFGVVGGLSAIVGPLLGGVLIALNLFGLGWRAVFLLNVPIGLLAVLAGIALLPRAERHPDRRIDLVGTVLFGAGLFAFLFPMIQEKRHGFDAAMVVWWLAALGLAGAGLIHQRRRQRKGQATVIEPGMFANDTFRLGVLISLGFSAANTGFLFVFAYALQRDLGFSALQTGLLHVPFSAGVMFAMAFLVRRFLAQYGRLVLIVGAIIMGAGCMGILGWMALGAVRPVLLIPVLLLAGVGMGLVSGPLGAVSVARVERQQAGSASGIIKTVQQMGGALGIALVGSAYLRFAENERGEAAALAVMLALLALCLFWAARLPKEIFPRQAG